MKGKNIIVWIIAVLTAIAMAGCNTSSASAGNTQVANPGEDCISVVATIFAPYDFAREIAGDNADITMLLPPGSETHSFEPTPQDIIAIQDCDVFIYVGGESDDWIDRILDSMDTKNKTIVPLIDCVEPVEEAIIEGMQEDKESSGNNAIDKTEPEYDEHIWTSPKNAKLIANEISGALCKADEANEVLYEQNADVYMEKLDILDAEFRTVVDGAARKTIVFGDRFPFRYFADAYGLDCFAAFPGCSTETEPSAKTVAFLIDKIEDEQIPVVFHIELSNEKMADTLCAETGAKKLLLHSCHNISKDDFQNGLSYLKLMTRNVTALKEALY